MVYNTKQYELASDRIHNNHSNDGRVLLRLVIIIAVLINMYCGMSAIAKPVESLQQYQLTSANFVQMEYGFKPAY